jgi:Lrp/AsnC family transcriptional regulator for asnA, asnC and gidA
MRLSKPPPGTAVVQLDDVDRGIIAALQQDGRAGNSAIAEQLGVTEGTVRQRMKKLLDADLLRVTGLVNPEVVPDHQLCVLGIKIDETKHLEARARAVSALPEVRSVAIVTGRYDLLVEAIVPSNHGLIQFLAESLAQVPGIESSETFLLLKTFGKWV